VRLSTEGAVEQPTSAIAASATAAPSDARQFEGSARSSPLQRD
jgi:hypothetical protein